MIEKSCLRSDLFLMLPSGAVVLHLGLWLLWYHLPEARLPHYLISHCLHIFLLNWDLSPAIGGLPDVWMRSHSALDLDRWKNLRYLSAIGVLTCILKDLACVSQSGADRSAWPICRDPLVVYDPFRLWTRGVHKDRDGFWWRRTPRLSFPPPSSSSSFLTW